MHRKADTARVIEERKRNTGRNEKERKGRKKCSFLFFGICNFYERMSEMVNPKQIFSQIIIFEKVFKFQIVMKLGKMVFIWGPRWEIINSWWLMALMCSWLLKDIFCSWVTTEATAWILLFNLLFPFLGEPALDLGVESLWSQQDPKGLKEKLRQWGWCQRLSTLRENVGLRKERMKNDYKDWQSVTWTKCLG